MKIKIISYGHKFYEELGLKAPYHDFLFSLRDFINPYWEPELRDFNGTQEPIAKFFEKDPRTAQRLDKIQDLLKDFVDDFLENSYRSDREQIVIAFKCTGGKHRSVYFAQKIFERMQAHYQDQLSYELDHVDLAKYVEDYEVVKI
jgi:UPF0042 nucleotide-binding protein